MKWITALLSALSVLTLLASACPTGSRQRVIIVAPVVAVPVVLVPAYSVSYLPPPSPAPTGTSTPAPAGEPAPAFAKVLGERCAACHAAAAADAKGGGFQLIDAANKLVPLSLGEQRKIKAKIAAVDDKRMPPPPAPALTDAEKKAFADFLK